MHRQIWTRHLRRRRRCRWEDEAMCPFSFTPPLRPARSGTPRGQKPPRARGGLRRWRGSSEGALAAAEEVEVARGSDGGRPRCWFRLDVEHLEANNRHRKKNSVLTSFFRRPKQADYLLFVFFYLFTNSLNAYSNYTSASSPTIVIPPRS